jgi:amino acid transporter
MLTPGVDITLLLLIVGIFTIADGITTSLLQSSMPRSGGGYISISRSLGPLWGTMEAYRAFITNPLANAIQAYIAASTVGGIVSQIGYALNDPSLTTTGKILAANPSVTVSFTVLFIFLAFISDFFGPKFMSRWYTLGGILTIVGILLMWVTLAGINPTNLQQAWDARWGAGAYNEIVTTATTGGYTSVPLNWEKMALTMATPFALMGQYNTIVIAGEIEQPKKTLPTITMAAAVILITFYAGTAALVTNAFGEFAKMYGYVATRPALAGTLVKNVAVSPNWAFYSMSVAANPAIACYISITPLLSLVAAFPQPGIWTSRNLFALAFDRMLPSFFTKVNRWHAPTYCCIFYLILSLIFTMMMTTWYWALTISMFLTFLTLRLMWSLGGIVFPFVRPQLHERGLAWKIGGFPVITITGLICAVFMWFALLTGATLSTVIAWLFVYAAGMIGYAIASYVNARRGIDVSKIFGELPPE